MVLYAILFYIARNDFIFALLHPEDRVNGCFPWQPGAGRPHPSSSRIRAPCLVTDGCISITVTWVLSSFSPAAFAPHLPHFGVRPAYLPLPSHTDTVCWQFTGCPLFLCFLYLLCTAGNSKVAVLQPAHGTAAVSLQPLVTGETDWESLQVLGWGEKTNKHTMLVSFICSLRGGWISDTSWPPHLARLGLGLGLIQ